MGETVNIATIAEKVSHDIFRHFHWEIHQQENTDFPCVLDTHHTPNGDQKKTHPADVVFHYIDPYLNKRVYLHTDLKSYSKSTLKIGKIREALRSLASTVECAHVSEGWRDLYLTDKAEGYEIRGLLFVANHDGKASGAFDEHLSKISTNGLGIAKGQVLHVLGPKTISDLYSVAADIRLAIADQQLSSKYRFFYPDLTLWNRRTVDDLRIGATIESLLSPYFILRHDAVKGESGEVLQRAGSLVYYARKGETVEEFIYLLDSLLRYQLVNSKEQVRIRVFNRDRSAQIKNNFEKAKENYCRSWGFDGDREAEIKEIKIDSIAQICPNYCPEEIGWREE